MLAKLNQQNKQKRILLTRGTNFGKAHGVGYLSYVSRTNIRGPRPINSHTPVPIGPIFEPVGPAKVGTPINIFPPYFVDVTLCRSFSKYLIHAISLLSNSKCGQIPCFANGCCFNSFVCHGVKMSFPSISIYFNSCLHSG